MKISYNWLKRLVDFDATPEKLADILTFQCVELEDMKVFKRNVDGVIVGKVLESKKHPDADKLSVTKVDTGSEIVQIVCGAPNCREGLTVAVALPGVKIGDITIGSRKLRGVESNGMILSEAEMGISDDHGGILELPADLTLGTKLDTLVEPEDTILDFEVTVNRPDLLSHIGIAREIAAHFRTTVKMPDYDFDEDSRLTSERIQVEIKHWKEGPRYHARMVEGSSVIPSPLWMKARLHSLGQRPINNLVDISNFVMFELGQPLHAFDYHLVKDGKVIVRLAEDGEHFITLDGQERILKSTDLLITDPEKGIGIAGVMGGENSEVKDNTTDVLIEAAHFNPVSIRRTSKHLGLSTEASRRFERGADPSMPPIAAARCAYLIQKHGGGRILAGGVDTYPHAIRPKYVEMRPSRASHLLGINVSSDTAKETLEALTMRVEEKNADLLKVQVPMFRHYDIEREVDLIEEVARIIGYNKVPDAQRSNVVLDSPGMPLEDLTDAAVDTMVSLGFRESVHSAMVSREDQEKFSDTLKVEVISQPLNPEMNVYRASLLPNLLNTLSRELNRGADSVRLFEVGQVGGVDWFGQKADQRIHLAFAVAGAYSPTEFDRKPGLYDFYDIKGDVEALAAGLSLDKAPTFEYDVVDNLQLSFVFSTKEHGRTGQGGILRQDVGARYGIEQPVCIFEVDLIRWAGDQIDDVKRPGSPHGYSTFSRFPSNERDLAFLVEGQISAQSIEDIIRKEGGELLRDVELFDLFQGKPLAKNQRSLAYHLVFRADDRTLTDEEVTPCVKKIIGRVTGLDGVQLRG